MLQLMPTLLKPAGRAYDLDEGSPTSSTLPHSFLSRWRPRLRSVVSPKQTRNC
jgi:hypothetical protein